MKRVCLFFVLFSFGMSSWAWKAWPLPMDSVDNKYDTISYCGEFMGLASSGKFAPFWFSANRDGVVSFAPYSTLLRARIDKEAIRESRWWDYSYGVDISGGVDLYGWNAQIVRLYAHARLWCFDILLGIKPFDLGNHDYELSSGGFLFSRNAPSMPRLSIGIDKYTSLPFSYGYLEVKGGLTHGWFFNTKGTKNTLLHHKYLGVRIGGKLPINVNYEFHHVAQWGGVSDMYGQLGSSVRDWWAVFKASSGGVMNNDQVNAMGNHVGSQMLGVELKYKGWYVNAYWQSLFEDGPIRYIWNAKNVVDGLWGVAIKQSHWRFVEAITYEFFATTDQSGPVHDLDGIVFGGKDNYFNNIIYPQGWGYMGYTIGNPFITSSNYTNTIDIINNRTFTHHLALKGDILGFNYIFRYSHSDNYGTYDLPCRTHNNSFYFSVKKMVPQALNFNFGIAIGADCGTQFGNSIGAMVTISRSGIIWKSKR